MGPEMQCILKFEVMKVIFMGFYTCVQANFNATMWQLALLLLHIFWVRILAARPAILKEVYHLLSATFQARIG